MMKVKNEGITYQLKGDIDKIEDIERYTNEELVVLNGSIENKEEEDEVESDDEIIDQDNEDCVIEDNNETKQTTPCTINARERNTISYNNRKSDNCSRLGTKTSESYIYTKMINTSKNDDVKVKTIFSKITEEISAKYLSKNMSRNQLYDDLISESIINSQLEKEEGKLNKIKFDNMMKRHTLYDQEKENHLKKRKEDELQKMKGNCTMIIVNKDKKSCSQSPIRNAKQFYNDQRMLAVKRDNSIQMNKAQQEEKEKMLNTPKPTISKYSKELASNKVKRDSSSVNIWERLTTEKIHQKRLDIKNAFDEPIQKKVNKEDQKVLITRLAKSKGKTNDHGIPKPLVKYVKCNNFLMSSSTKKFLLEKYVLLFNSSMNSLVNQQDNILLEYDQYKELLTIIGFVNNANDNNTSLIQHNKEEELIKLCYNKYVRAKDGKVYSNWVLLFGLCLLGVYDNEIIDDEIKEKKEENSQDILNKPNKKPWIERHLKHIDHKEYYYDQPTAQSIKSTFFLFNENLSAKWKRESTEKRIIIMNKYAEKEHKGYQSCYSSGNMNNNNQNHPPVKDNPNTINTDNKPKLIHLYSRNNNKRNQEILDMSSKKEQKELEECTFQPNSHKKINILDINAKIEKLYTDGKIRHIIKKTETSTIDDNNYMRQKDICTFTPVLTSLNKSMFDTNPIALDQTKPKPKPINIYTFNREGMHFGIEARSNKDTFDQFKHSKNK